MPLRAKPGIYTCLLGCWVVVHSCSTQFLIQLRFKIMPCSQSLRRLWILGCEHFNPDVIAALPVRLLTADFDGQLYFRGRAGPALQALDTSKEQPWLALAETLFR